jgi:hypothetical protein
MWPVYVEAHFLSFSPALPKGSGATYVGSLFVKSDTDIRSVETSARPGYEFGGWWTGTNNGDDKVPDVVYGQQVTDANGVMLANLSSLTNALGETVAVEAGELLHLVMDLPEIRRPHINGEFLSQRQVGIQLDRTDFNNLSPQMNRELIKNRGVRPHCLVPFKIHHNIAHTNNMFLYFSCPAIIT